MRKAYPSDITREQFSVIEADLAAAKKETHPRENELYDIFCAVQYLLKEGCRWRSLPHDFPKWQNVYYHFRIWKAPGEGGESLLDKVLRKLVEAERVEKGRDEQTTMLIVDSRSVKNAFTAEEKGYDAGKKRPYYYSNASTDRPKMIHNAKFIYTYLREKGWAKESIWAVLGNMLEESKVNPGMWQGATPTTSGNGPGFGLVQWDPDGKFRTDNYYDPVSKTYSGWYRTANHPDDCMICQLERIIFEDSVPSAQRQWMRNTTRDQAAYYSADLAKNRVPYDSFTDFKINKNGRSAEMLAKMWMIYYESPGTVTAFYNNPNPPSGSAQITNLRIMLANRAAYANHP